MTKSGRLQRNLVLSAICFLGVFGSQLGFAVEYPEIQPGEMSRRQKTEAIERPAEVSTLPDLIDWVERNFLKVKLNYPVHIFRRDELDFELAKLGLLGRENLSQRIAYLKAYFQEKTGVEITHNEAANLDTYVSDLRESAFAFPMFTETWIEGTRSVKQKLCVVFPAEESSNQKMETERILGLGHKNAYQKSENFHSLRTRMSFHELRMFSLLHELGHCLDGHFMPQVEPSMGDAHAVHLSESFAESFAALVMETLGYRGISQRRSELRGIYSVKMGNFFMSNPQLGFGDENFKRGGIIYFLTPVLREISQQFEGKNQKASESMPRFFSIGSWNVKQLLQESKDIVQRSALGVRSFFAIGLSMEEGRSHTIEKYLLLSKESPDLFAGAYQQLVAYHQVTGEIIEGAFNKEHSHQDPGYSMGESFAFAELCDAFRKGDDLRFRNTLRIERMRLRKSSFANPQEQSRFGAQLKDLYIDLQKSCRAPHYP